MSMFLNTSAPAMGSNGLLIDNEMRGQPADWISPLEDACPFGAMAPFTDAVLWPRARVMAGDLSSPLGLGLSEEAASTGRFAPPRNQDSGGQQAKKITGITRDSNGNGLGSCLVQAFLTTSDLFVTQVTSDSGGFFEIPTIYPGVQHYLVAYKVGIPDQAGSSVNTLVPT